MTGLADRVAGFGTATRLGLFAGVLAVSFGAAAAAGAGIGPIDVGGDVDHGDDEHGGPSIPAPDDGPGGLGVTSHGYRLEVDQRSLGAGTASTLTFRILDERESGRTTVETMFDVVHERPLHLVVVGRDLTTFHHLHPEMAAHGDWTVEVPALAAGSYRVYTDGRPTGGPDLTLATDVVVPGTVDAPAPWSPTMSDAVAGLDVALDGSTSVGTSTVSFTVTRDGEPVATDPYLGAAGHLVAIRASDLAYLHVHPESDDELSFAVEFPSPGRYALFLDIVVDGTLRTVSFHVDVHDGTDEPGHDEPGHDSTQDGDH